MKRYEIKITRAGNTQTSERDSMAEVRIILEGFVRLQGCMFSVSRQADGFTYTDAQTGVCVAIRDRKAPLTYVPRFAGDYVPGGAVYEHLPAAIRAQIREERLPDQLIFQDPEYRYIIDRKGRLLTGDLNDLCAILDPERKEVQVCEHCGVVGIEVGQSLCFMCSLGWEGIHQPDCPSRKGGKCSCERPHEPDCQSRRGGRCSCEEPKGEKMEALEKKDCYKCKHRNRPESANNLPAPVRRGSFGNKP